MHTRDSFGLEDRSLAAPVLPVCAGAARNLLMFAYYFPPESESGAKRPFRFVRYLEPRGFHTHVITASEQREGAPWPATTRVAEAARECRTPYALLAKVIQRVIPYNDRLPWAVEAAREASRLARTLHPEAVISTGPPTGCHVAALMLHRKFGLPWIADFRDPVRANPHRTRLLSRPWDSLVERIILRSACAVIANTDAAGEALRRRCPSAAHKVHVIWNGYDPADGIAARPIPARPYHLILHPGSLYGGRHPGALIDSLDVLISAGRLDAHRVRFRQIGTVDSDQAWLTSPATKRLQALGCIEIVPHMLPEPEALREMSEADSLLLLDGNAGGGAVQVPAKIFQYIRIGRPVLAFASSGSPAARILVGSGVRHLICTPGLPAAELATRVLSLFDLPSTPMQPSDWFESQFNGEAQTAALAAILEEAVRTR
jgi:hypothetical protein